MPPTTLIVFVGGLGANQFDEGCPTPAGQVAAACPNAICTSLNDCGYMFGVIPPIIEHIKAVKAAHPTITHTIVVIHSMGWIAGAKASIEGMVDYLIAVDPVGLPFVGSDHWPMQTDAATGLRVPVPGLYYTAEPTPFITPIVLLDAPKPIPLAVSHNPASHDPAVIAAIVNAAQGTF